VAAWSVDRLGRSLQDLVTFLGELQGAAVDFYLDRLGVDTSTPAGKALFQMLGVFAALERSIIQERLAAGIARARAKGTRSGKAFGRPRLSAERAALAEGIGIRRAARLAGTGNETHAEDFVHAMGITFYIVHNPGDDFLPVQEPPDDYQIVATVTPPSSAHETPQFDRE
jgi:DNA invertase Pin-like site-specific DNA recombinase